MIMSKEILITGGLGYIGSHTAIELLLKDHQVIIIDNLSNSRESVVDDIKNITHKDISFYKGDIRDRKFLESVLKNHSIDSVIHFAGLKSVSESVKRPLDYYDNNVFGSINLFETMLDHGIKNIVFSSSATVYGNNHPLPWHEDLVTGGTTNPYGYSKLVIENILKDIAISNRDFKCISLRYFNPVGAHKSGMIGENPIDVPNNLMPYLCKVALKQQERLNVYGGDYETRDGTGVRDYIHVQDLSRGHLLAYNYILGDGFKGFDAINLGSGQGYSVLEMINAFTEITGVKIPYEIVKRRDGDIAKALRIFLSLKNYFPGCPKKH